MSADHAILAVISSMPSSGYDIKNEFEHKAASLYWGMSYGSIYPKLKKLEEEGFIQAFENEISGRKKTLYELTAKGWSELENWLNATPAYPARKDELFMKMAAWHSEMDNRIFIKHLQKRKFESEDILAFISQWPSNGTSYISGLGMLGISYSKTILEAEIKWIDETIQTLLSNNLPASQDPNGLEEKIVQRRKKALNNELGGNADETIDV
ncbi:MULTISPECIES: PadR family transcriptional regulator [unclassified Bacillus (in: firmicutes)]|uniref:PadR family transcriptional regulator n=1 Tax=unclassified Bacillus (in: firmicutes) TaxID=185979 RepID=UPI0008E309C0|nr:MULTISPECIES: PadR family transcriptional regulator [unclassified Bacillus (in: firmicutes)]SFA76833.1 DNA-binding transcriptional regulator, PadR family [Bacillus sp. UNCCL13]SFQ66705.1 DNA-binding transcriptional regulator, PadR family [Bacillus sp. cl95]